MTIKDIARETGFSIGTVSRVLNNHPNVSEKTRRIVNEAIEKNGFLLNTSAKNLKQKASTQIVAIIKGYYNEMFSTMVEYLQSLINSSKYTLLIEYIDEEDNEVRRARQICQDVRVQGIFFFGGNTENFYSDFDKIECPCVLVTNDAGNLGFPNLSSVSTNDLEAAENAVEYLISCGHRKIALCGGTARSDTSYQRKKGWELANRLQGISDEERGPFVPGRYAYETGYDGMMQLLRDKVEFTAVFAVADVVAIGAISAINDFGLKVPDDISVVGFDGLKIGEYYSPKITTVEQNLKEIVKKSFDIISECIENGKPAVHVTVPFRLNVRQSVKNIVD